MSKQKSKNINLEVLNSHPLVKHATETRFSLTYECRLKIWEKFGDNVSAGNVRQFLKNQGIPVKLLKNYYCSHVARQIRRSGKPSRGKNKVAYQPLASQRTSAAGNKELLQTGYFEKSKRGIRFTREFKQIIASKYPEQSVEESLAEYGLNMDNVGYQRIYLLTREIEEGIDVTRKKAAIYSNEIVETLKDHPFVAYISAHQCRFTEVFFQLASLMKEDSVDDILRMADLDPDCFSNNVKSNLRYQISQLPVSNEDQLPAELRLALQIWFLQKKENSSSAAVDRLRPLIKRASPAARKRICESIRDFAASHEGSCIRELLNTYGISKSSYYYLLKHVPAASNPDPEDMRIVKEVFEEGGFQKGSRQICMQISVRYPDRKMDRKKVIRLMKIQNLQCTVRRAALHRKTQKQMVQENVQPNYLARHFHLGRPLTILLTDVTYLDYNGQRACKSAVKDAVTGRIPVSEISEFNDTNLVMNTLNRLREMHIPRGAIFHSDQGIFYLNPGFQEELKNMGLVQSMSRRGNCWDNAPMESHFGHFKEESGYQNCKDLDELKELDRKYTEYYNTVRRMECRFRMTPVEYEAYLSGMSTSEFRDYLDVEEQKYRLMQKKSAASEIEKNSTEKMRRLTWPSETSTKPLWIH